MIQKEIIKAIKAHDTIIIHRHQRPDPDALGSQFGLKKIIEASFPDKKVLAAGSSAGSLSYLGEMEEVSNEDYQEALVIITDTANAPRVDDERFSQGKWSIKIDHHPENKEGHYADLEWVESFRSSTSEMITALWYENQNELKMTQAAARVLYAGIIGDTNRFLYDATSPMTMRLAAELMTFDIDHTALIDQMQAMTEKEAKLMGYTLEHLEVLESGAAYLILTQEVLDQYGLSDQDTAGIVPLPRNIEGVVLWTIFVEQKDGSFRCRMRSKGPIINDIAQEHDGGGHTLASGANAKNLTEIKEIIAKMEERAREGSNNK